MKRKLTALALALVASCLFTLPARADGPVVCGTMSNPSLICSAAPPAPSPNFWDEAQAFVADVLAFIF
jgi:hypothetical protein